MGRFLSFFWRNARTAIQLVFTALTNGYAAGFLRGNIYKGPGKFVCVPGLNCYSCPGALGACPIGSLQAVLGSREYKFAFYVVGFFLLFGALLGRLVCGFLCPFGLVQDLLYKIPFARKIKRVPGDRWLKFVKYFILIGFVILLPLFAVDIIGQGQPWFCKYICPSGTLFAGVPLIAANPPLREALGWLFTWKSCILLGVVVLSVFFYRPFCKWLCPLGAFYGLCNKVSVYRLEVDQSKCTSCGACSRVCQMDVDVFRTPNHAECIRCGDCVAACPHQAITKTFSLKKQTNKKETI